MRKQSTRNHEIFVAIIAIIGFVATACGDQSPDWPGEDTATESNVATTTQGITGGTLVTSNTSPFSSVVRFAGGCTATKVSNRRFLTAGHCIGALGIAAGNIIQVTNALDGVSSTVNLTVASVFVHPSVDNVILYPNTDTSVEGHMAYDVAVVDVTTDTPNITRQPVDSIVFGDGIQGDDIGYGCDNTNPAHQGQKQVGNFTAMSLAALRASTGQSTAYTLDVYRHNATFDMALDGRQICPGDSGGPVIRIGDQAIAGINSVFAGPLSYVVRTANIRRWIEQPQSNVFQNGSGGFFLNAFTAKCIGVAGSPIEAESVICSAPRQELDSQFWTLQLQPSGYFTVVNGGNGNCLSIQRAALRAGVGLDARACTGSDTQSWKFTRVTSATLPGYYRIESKSPFVANLCVEATSDVNATVLTLQPCVEKTGQRWIFTE